MEEQLIKQVATGAMIAVMSALVTALLSKDKPVMVKLREFFAGVVLGTLLAFLFRDSTMSGMVREGIIVCASGFASRIWPLVEKKVAKWVNKKQPSDVLIDDHT
jgi:uncharacterized membrane protein YccC